MIWSREENALVQFFNNCSRDENTKEVIKDTSFSLRTKARSPAGTKQSLALRVLVDEMKPASVAPTVKPTVQQLKVIVLNLSKNLSLTRNFRV